MNRFVIAAFVAAAGLAPAALQALDYQIDPSHSTAGFAVRHMMLSNVHGQFSKVTGSVSYDPANVAATRIDAVVDINTISTGEVQRDGHLKSPDFFDVAKYPNMTFKSKKVAKSAAGGLAVTGDLTLHGVTKEVVLNVDTLPSEIKDAKGVYHAGASASAKINRKDFGLVWNKNLETGGVLVGDDVAITLEVELSRKDGATPSSR